MQITIEKEFSEVFAEFIKEQGNLRYSCRLSVDEAAYYIRELIFLLPSNKTEAEAILTALTERGNDEVTQLVREGLCE